VKKKSLKSLRNDEGHLIEAVVLAEAHWKWLEKTLHMVYVDAMAHGFGHGVEWERFRPKTPVELIDFEEMVQGWKERSKKK